MSIETDPVPPVPQHTPPIDKRVGALERFENNWMQWFIALRNKINIINDLLVNFSNLTGSGFPSLDNSGATPVWNTRTIQAGTAITVTNGNGVAGNPSIAHADTSSVSDLNSNNSDGVVIQDYAVTFDTFGHVQTVSVATKDTWASPVLTGNPVAPTPSDNDDDTSVATTEFVNNAMPKGYIEGLQMQWVSATAVTVDVGSAYIESLGRIVRASSAIAKSSLSLSASTWYHVYLYLNAGTPDIEIVTTAPVSYFGTARSKSGDSSRRYVGSIRTDGAGSIYNFLMVCGDTISYRINPGTAPFRILSGGSATTETTVSASAVIPVTSRLAFIRAIDIDATAILRTGTSDDSVTGPPSDSIMALSPNTQAFLYHPMDSSQAMTYWFETAPAAGNGYIDLYGYRYDR